MFNVSQTLGSLSKFFIPKSRPHLKKNKNIMLFICVMPSQSLLSSGLDNSNDSYCLRFDVSYDNNCLRFDVSNDSYCLRFDVSNDSNCLRFDVSYDNNCLRFGCLSLYEGFSFPSQRTLLISLCERWLPIYTITFYICFPCFTNPTLTCQSFYSFLFGLIINF